MASVYERLPPPPHQLTFPPQPQQPCVTPCLCCCRWCLPQPTGVSQHPSGAQVCLNHTTCGTSNAPGAPTLTSISSNCSSTSFQRGLPGSLSSSLYPYCSRRLSTSVDDRPFSKLVCCCCTTCCAVCTQGGDELICTVSVCKASSHTHTHVWRPTNVYHGVIWKVVKGVWLVRAVCSDALVHCPLVCSTLAELNHRETECAVVEEGSSCLHSWCVAGC